MLTRVSNASVFRFIAVLGCCLLAGCATGQPSLTPSNVPVRDVNPDEARSDASLPLLGAETESWPEASTPATAVRWGGSVARIENLTQGITLLEIVSRPLSRNGRPLHNDRSSGRFIALVKDFLDPQIVEAGRDMTVIGSLVARREGQIGKSEYVFPVVEAETHTLWKRPVESTQIHFPHWNTYPHRYQDPYYRDPFWPAWIIYRPNP